MHSLAELTWEALPWGLSEYQRDLKSQPAKKKKKMKFNEKSQNIFCLLKINQLYLNKLVETCEFLREDCVHTLIFDNREDFLYLWNIKRLWEIS